MIRIFIILFICWLTAFSVSAGNLVRSNLFAVEKVFELNAGRTVMKISANGGRIISYKYDGNEILTQASEHENFGSTLWTAPQSDWGWPPFNVLDNKEYSVEKTGNLLKMTSELDPKSGFQMVKSWRVLENNSIQIEYQIKNISEKAKSVGSWEVTRVTCGGVAFFPDGGEANVPKSGFNPDLQKDGIKWFSVDRNPIEGSVKMFSTAKEGWLAYAFNGVIFIKNFPDTKPENYSPKQAEVEIYIDKEKSYIELENHGPYQLLQPGESITYNENWFLISIPQNMIIKPGNVELPDLVRQQLKPKNQQN